MFTRSHASQSLLSPKEYWDPSFFKLEQEQLHDRSWHWACLKSDVSSHGQYCSRVVSGMPLIVWNKEGKIRAFKNVCLHRHSKIVPDGCGSQNLLRCQYHGWEYDPAGRLNRIPDAPSFRGLTLPVCLDEFRVETIGDCVLVSFAADNPSMRELLGDISEEIDRSFSSWRLFHRNIREINVNWKLILENALESYHVPLVHPHSFKVYQPEEQHDHRLDRLYSRYFDLRPWTSTIFGRIYLLVAKFIVFKPENRRFAHTHLFPNLLFYYGSLFSIFYFVEPLTAETSRLSCFFYLPSKLRYPWVSRGLQLLMQPWLKFIFFRILEEDLRILEDVQAGVRSAETSGILGVREERIFAFQSYLREILVTRPSIRYTEVPGNGASL